MAISYTPLWETMKDRGATTYTLKYKLKIGGGTYNRLRNNLPVSTNTIDILCDFLDCNVQEVMHHIKKKDG